MPTTRDASRTCSVGSEYSGAMRTAVCCFDVVAVGSSTPPAVHAASLQELLVDDLTEQLLRVVVELTGGRLVEDRGELPLQLPGVEEELPIDVLNERRERRLEHLRAKQRRLRQVFERNALFVCACVLDREQRLALFLGVLFAEPFLKLPVLLRKRCLAGRVEQVRDDADDA